MLLKNLIKNTPQIPEKLIKAVVAHSGGWEDFQESAPDIARNDIMGGFHGWIYHKDTCSFFQKNRDLILEYSHSLSKELGEDMLTMIQNFGCLKDAELNQHELALALYTGKGDDDVVVQVENAMAWFAAEEVAQAYYRIIEEGGNND